MKKLKQGLLLAVLLLLGAYVAIPLAKHQVDLWRIKKSVIFFAALNMTISMI